DECSMQNCFAFEAANRTLKDIQNNTLLFRGITTVLGRDFLQILPVVRNSSKSDILNACLLFSPLWPSIFPNFLCLEQNMCIGQTDSKQEFAKWLRNLM
ncbi:DNA helicase Pif1 like protein, partial [Lactarius quietus]